MVSLFFILLALTQVPTGQGDTKSARAFSGAKVAKPSATVALGIDNLFESEAFRLMEGKRIGLVTNASGVDRHLVSTRLRLKRDRRVSLVQLFAPEHGLDGVAPAGKALKDSIDQQTGLPVQSLFGRQRAPTKKALAGVDVLVFDIQDIGSRTYTYASTMGECMVRAKEVGIPFVVLDRPNPLGGVRFEGPVLPAKRFGFLGWGPTPVSHGMTMGELARFFNDTKRIGADLYVVRMTGWKRDMLWDDTGLNWVQTSPAIPQRLNAYLYIATGMVGGVSKNVNEGYGTTSPFERIGAEFITDPYAFTDAMNRAGLPGVRFIPVIYRPSYSRFKGKTLMGTQLVVTDPDLFEPLRTALTLLTELERIYPGETVFRRWTFNAIWGDPQIMRDVQAGKQPAEIIAKWEKGLKEFDVSRRRALLYSE